MVRVADLRSDFWYSSIARSMSSGAILGYFKQLLIAAEGPDGQAAGKADIVAAMFVVVEDTSGVEGYQGLQVN